MLYLHYFISSDWQGNLALSSVGILDDTTLPHLGAISPFNILAKIAKSIPFCWTKSPTPNYLFLSLYPKFLVMKQYTIFLTCLMFACSY